MEFLSLLLFALYLGGVLCISDGHFYQKEYSLGTKLIVGALFIYSVFHTEKVLAIIKKLKEYEFLCVWGTFILFTDEVHLFS